MGEFGWAYISGSAAPGGIDGSVQLKNGTDFTGSSKLTFNETNGLIVTGSVKISGSLVANEYKVNVVDETVTRIYSSGSTKFGNTVDDTHQFTGSMFLSSGAGSNLVYRVTSSFHTQLSDAQKASAPIVGNYFFLSSSVAAHRGILNTTITSGSNQILVSDTSEFLRTDNPALVVSGAAVFNDPVSIQGGIFGASPVNVYAPLLFRRDDLGDTEVPDEEMKIEKGKFVGNLVLSSSNDNHGLFIQGAGRIVMNSLQNISGTNASTAEPAPEILMVNNTPGQYSKPILDMRNLNNINVNEHQFFLTRKHSNSRFHAGEMRFRLELPVLTGSNSSSSSHYETVNYDIARTLIQSDPRRNSHLFFIQTLESNIDPEYELLDATNDAARNASGSTKPIIHPDSPMYTASVDNYSASLFNVFSAGSFASPGQGNVYGVKRGITVFGNILPTTHSLNGSGLDKIEISASECTIGHPVARWGDFYIHDDRYIRWGQPAGGGTSYKDFYNSNPTTASARTDSGSVMLGYNATSTFLEVTGGAVFLDAGLNVTASGYINFGTTKGTGGYGMRDNAGTLQFKNSGGAWADFGSGGGGGTIGAAEDGNYDDGLFTDLTSSMAVGIPIDRFNEVLKILAPSPSPALSRIDFTNTAGSTAKLTFDASNQITDYANSSTNAGFSAVLEDGIYESTSSGNNRRLGVYDGTQDIEGVLNFNVVQSTNNGNIAYSADSFGNAETGSLKLELNGAVVHTVNLASFGSGNNYLNSTGSGFTSLSATASTLDGNGANWGSIFNYRTGQYKIDTLDQRAGWNYARIIHTVGSTDYATNYVEWINDPDGAALALSVANARIENVNLVGSKYLSGVQYNTDLTANYKVDINNIYRNVYPDGNIISFNVSNSDAISSQALEALGASEDETKVAKITGSVNNNQNLLLNGTITVSLNATHPLKSNLSSAGSVSLTGMLIDNDSSGPNSNLVETFIDEDFRITSASYNTQGSVTAGAATWNSQTHMTGTNVDGHQDGMLFYNRRLYSPKDSDVAAVGNIASLANVSAGQPNYNTISGIRTFYRKIQNTSGGTIRDLKITSAKNGFKFSADTQALDTNDSHFFVKIPGSTGFMNIREDFAYGSTSDGDGALINGASDNSNVGGTGDSVHCVTFGTQSVANNEYVVIKIETNGIQGYVSQLDFQLGASDVSAPTEAPALDDIDLDDAAGVTAKLSFGTSNGITGYTNVAGGKGSMGAVNSNAVYTDNGDTNRGAFKTIEVMNGTLNEDVSSNGNNYAANSFKNAYTGSLLLIVNDTTASTLSLANLNTNNNLSSDTGFSVGAVGFSTTTDDIPDYTKTYRTGTYSIGTSQQRSGWNYARVIHRIGASDTTTNYVQWVVDTSGAVDNTAVSSPVISNFNHPTPYYQSGIKYFASNPSGSFAFTGSNFYNNVYQNGTAISFPTTTNCSVSNIRITGSGITTFDSAVSSCDMPALNNSADCETTSIQVTGTILYNGSTPSISGGLGLFTDRDVTVTGRILHPLKSDRTTNSASKTSFMIYSGSIGSTTLTNNEYFNTETYRVVSGNYDNQAALTSSTNTWNSQTAMNNGGTHDDGMVSVNGYALSPLKIGNSGDTRNVADGGVLQAPTGNPNYSTLSNGTRTFYRQFRYTGASTVASFNLKLYGDANLVGKSGTYAASLGANKNCFVELKVPFDPNFSGADDQSTDWADCAKIFESSAQPNILGAGIRAGSFSGEDQTIDGDGLDLSLTLGTRRIKQNQYFVVKISVDGAWTGYLSRIEVTY